MKAIEVKNINKSYGRVQALSDVSFAVGKGEVFGLIGPDGAGKTSMFRILCSLLLPDAGTAAVDGYDVVKQMREVRCRVGYMPGKFSLYQDLTLADRKRHIAERQHLAVRFTDVLYLYCVHSFSSPYIPIFTKPSFLIATLTAYTRSARSSSVRIVLGVNSERDDIQLMVPAYSLRCPSP